MKITEIKQPYDHIKFIFEEFNEIRGKRGINTLANILAQQMSQLFHDPRNFIYELLQNADDANAKKVIFKIKGNDVFLEHDGDHFNYNDVDRICDAARDNDKDENSKVQQCKKIGYKGIGFKSVFGISSQVEILSAGNGYFFQFSKNYWEKEAEKQEDENIPWQIIPIWLKEEDRSYYENDKNKANNQKDPVIFILRQVDLIRIKNELKAIIDHPEILVFFRNIEHIYLEFDQGYTLRKEKKEDNLLYIHTETSEKKN